MGEHSNDVATAEALTRAHPDEARAWIILAVAHGTLHHEAELEAAVARAIALGFQEGADLKTAVAAPY